MMKLDRWKLALGGLIAMATIAGVPQSISAQENKPLRVADVYPVKHPVPNSTIHPFMKEVEERTGGEVTFEYYPSQQLGKGKDLLSLTLSGVVDVGLVVPSYVSDKMPLSGVAELPGSYASSCEGTKALWKLMQNGGALARHEFDPNGVQVLIVHAFAPFQAWSAKGLSSLDEFEGQKIRSLGAVMDLTIKQLGGIPIRISAPEIYESLSRGTIDGGLLGVPTVLSYDLVKHLSYGTRGKNFGGAVVTYTVSKEKWATFSQETQKIMLEAGWNATVSGCETADKQVDPSYEKVKEAGIEIVELSPADSKKLDNALMTVGDKWASGLDERGLPGSEVADAFRAELSAMN